jgi:hypothetical protein
MLKDFWRGHVSIEWQSRSTLHAHISVLQMNIEKCCSWSCICNSKRVKVSDTREGTRIVETGCRVLCGGSRCSCRSGCTGGCRCCCRSGSTVSCCSDYLD